MYRVRKKNIARKPANAISCVASAAASPLMRKIDSGSSGFLLRRSLTTNAASSASAPASSAIVRAAAPALIGRLHERVDQQQHPAGGEDRSEEVEVPRAARGGGRRGSAGRSPTSTSTAASGLTNITQRQPGPSVSRPPRSTPAAEASPPMPPQTPSAVLRSRALLEGRGQDRQRGREHHRGADALREAGADQHARAAGEAADQRGERRSATVPATSTRRRPSRSAARPPSSMKPP